MEKQSVIIKHLRPGDEDRFKGAIRLLKKVFEVPDEDMPTNNYLNQLLGDTKFIVLVAARQDKIIAALTAYELTKYYSERSEIFLYDIAVDEEYQRAGIGSMLLTELKKHCKSRGISEFFVAAHTEDKHALCFYKSNGGEKDDVNHFTFRF